MKTQNKEMLSDLERKVLSTIWPDKRKRGKISIAQLATIDRVIIVVRTYKPQEDEIKTV